MSEEETLHITLTVNGKAVTAAVEPRTHLADFLREQLLLTGTHLGCEHGVCGACTVSIDGQIARACISREFHVLESRGSSPVTVWLCALCRQVHAECGGSRQRARPLRRRHL